jgi:hypothetical protein
MARRHNILILCIRALVVFGIAFIGCFFFAKQIFNVLTWPYVWAGAPKLIFTATSEYFRRSAKGCLVRCRFHLVSGGGRAALHVRGV